MQNEIQTKEKLLLHFEICSSLLRSISLSLKVLSREFGDLAKHKSSSQFPKLPPTTELHSTFGGEKEQDSQVSDLSTDNARGEKLAPSIQPSGSLAQTGG